MLHQTRKTHSSLHYSLVASSGDTKFLVVNCSSPTSIVGYHRTQQHRRPAHTAYSIKAQFSSSFVNCSCSRFPLPGFQLKSKLCACWNRNLCLSTNFRCISIATVFVQLHCLDFPFPLISVIEIICVCFLLSLQWCICSFSA